MRRYQDAGNSPFARALSTDVRETLSDLEIVCHVNSDMMSAHVILSPLVTFNMQTKKRCQLW